jgi:hypothetical protein
LNETSISYGDGTDYHNLEHSFGSTFDNLEHSSHGASPNASSSLSMTENVDGQKMSVSEEESLEKLEVECQEQILQSSTESSGIIDVVEEAIALSEPNPQEDYADGNGDDGHDGSIIDMHKEEFSNSSPVKVGRDFGYMDEYLTNILQYYIEKTVVFFYSKSFQC